MSRPRNRNATTRRSDATVGTDRALSRMLRDADPAVGNTLPPIERAAMRQVVMETAARSRSAAVGPWSRLALAAAALIAAAGLTLVATQGGLEDGLETATGRVTATPDRDTVDARQGEAAAPGAEAKVPENEAMETETESEVMASANEAVSPETGAVADAPPIDRSRRVLQFTAPRGTRIIWTLDPTFESPIDGPSPDQEEAP